MLRLKELHLILWVYLWPRNQRHQFASHSFEAFLLEYSLDEFNTQWLQATKNIAVTFWISNIDVFLDELKSLLDLAPIEAFISLSEEARDLEIADSCDFRVAIFNNKSLFQVLKYFRL